MPWRIMAISFIYIGLVQHIIALWSELTNLAKLDMFPIQTFLELKRRQVPISRIPQPPILVYGPHSMNGRYLKPPSQLFPCSESDFSFRGVPWPCWPLFRPAKDEVAALACRGYKWERRHSTSYLDVYCWEIRESYSFSTHRVEMVHDFGQKIPWKIGLGDLDFVNRFYSSQTNLSAKNRGCSILIYPRGCQLAKKKWGLPATLMGL